MKEQTSNGKPDPPMGCALPFFLLLIIVVACSFYFSNVLYKMHQSRSWITTEATIIDSNLKVKSRRGRKTSRAEAYYSYEIDGINYQNDRVTFFDLGEDNVGRSFHISKKLSTASKVLIFVNPKKPEESTIITGMTNSFVFPIWIWSILLFLTYCYYRMLYRNSIGWKKVGMTLFLFWCSGMVLFFTNIFTIDVEKKITVLEQKEIVENKPPLELVKIDVQRGIDNNLFSNFVGTKEVSEIQVLNIRSMFGNQKSPYIVYIQFSFDSNGVKDTFKGTIIYQLKDSNWVADFQ